MGITEYKNIIEEFALNSSENAFDIIRKLGYGEEESNGALNRINKLWNSLLSGYLEDPENILKTFKNVSYDEMIIVKDIEIYSLCEHHFLPFFGKAHFAYIPGSEIVGLSKIPRLINMYCKRLQLQERLVEQIVDSFIDVVNPKGCAILIECQHLCMKMRGVEKQNASMITTALRGCFQQSDVKAEFLSAIRNGGK